MKRIKLSEFNDTMGILIDVQHPLDYQKHPFSKINIYADKLLMNYKSCLDYQKKYYIICEKGYLSNITSITFFIFIRKLYIIWFVDNV